MSTRTVAALYIDPLGPYPLMSGVESWDEARDARRYAGPHPVVAHPPCGPWGMLARRCKKQDASLGPIAFAQVRRFGGVLEHPAASRLFRACDAPHPGELPDAFGGVTLAVEQVEWDHKCRKPTWIYLVGVRPDRYPRMPPRKPTHGIWHGESERRHGSRLIAASREIRRRTPPAFAEFLVELARASDLSRAAVSA